MNHFSILASADPISHLLEKNTFLGLKLPDWLWMDWADGGLGISKPVIYLILGSLIAFLMFRYIASVYAKTDAIPRIKPRKKAKSMYWYLLFPLIPIFMIQWLYKVIFEPGENGTSKFQALLEPVLFFIKDDIVQPNLKSKELTTKFLPYFWSMFFFILFCNLIGLTPLAVTPTGQISVTATLAGISLITIVGAGMWQLGGMKYWKELVPHDVPVWIKPFIFVIEIVGLIAKPFALAIRLLANMTGGHVVLFVLLTFAVGANLFAPFYGFETEFPAGMALGVPVMVVSILGVVALLVFEVVVALVQAYVFTLLTAIFVGMAMHPEH